jgi:hypothetical protein
VNGVEFRKSYSTCYLGWFPKPLLPLQIRTDYHYLASSVPTLWVGYRYACSNWEGESGDGLITFLPRLWAEWLLALFQCPLGVLWGSLWRPPSPPCTWPFAAGHQETPGLYQAISPESPESQVSLLTSHSGLSSLFWFVYNMKRYEKGGCSTLLVCIWSLQDCPPSLGEHRCRALSSRREQSVEGLLMAGGSVRWNIYWSRSQVSRKCSQRLWPVQ